MTRPAPVFRLRPRVERQVEVIQAALDVGGWDEHVRVALVERLALRLTEPERWSFVMLAARADLTAAFIHEIMIGPRRLAALACWQALAPYVRRDTGELVCTQRTLAKTAHLSVADVYYGLKRLVEIGALERCGRGQYRVHPRLMWKGELAKREKAEAAAPALRLVPA